MKKYSIVIAMVLVLALTVSTFAASFADVPSNHWAYEAVNKLVAAGLIQGYPDGTFKGQNDLTRYEVAVMLGRLLNDIEDARAELVDQVDFMVNDALIEANSGLSEAEGEEVVAIVEALIAKNTPKTVEAVVPTELTVEQAAEVMDIVSALTGEFEPELYSLGVDVAALTEDVAGLDSRVAALETASEAAVTFSGEYKVEFSNVDTSGDPIEKEEGSEFFFTDPYDTNSGDYEENSDGDSDTDNDNSTGDYRLTDGEDYWEAENKLENTLDLDVAVNKGELSADLNMKAFNNTFNTDDDQNNYELDSLSGTITSGDLTVNVQDGNAVAWKDYLFDDAELDGVVANYGDSVLVISNQNEDETDSAYDVAVADGFATPGDYLNDGEDDEEFYVNRNVLRAALKTGFDLVLPVNMYVGFETKENVDADVWYNDDDDATTFVSPAFTKEDTTIVAFDTAVALDLFDVTADFAFNPGTKIADSRLFRIGATGDVDMFDVAFNYESTKNMAFIMDDTDATKEGYDVEVGTTLGVVDGSVKFEDYGTTKTIFKAAVPAGNVTLGSIDVDGSYELETTEADEFKEIRAINAATSLSGIDLTYAYEYDVDNENNDPETDVLDDGDNLDPTDPADVAIADDDEIVEEDEDVNKHTVAASYAVMENLTAGFKAEFEKDVLNDTVAKRNDVVFNDFDNTYTVTADYAKDAVTAGFEHVLDGKTTVNGRYTADMYEAGVEKVFNDGDDSDLIVDGKVTAPEYTFADIAVNSNAIAMFNVTDETRNLAVNVDLSKAISDALSLTAGFGYADKEIDVDYAGKVVSADLGAEYKISEDITANAAYKSFDFDGAKEYHVNEATAGVSVAF